MAERFQRWASNPFHPTHRWKEGFETWPDPFEEVCDPVSAAAQEWATRWRDHPGFPDYPCRDKNGQIVLPSSTEQTPDEYLDENTDPAPAPEPMQLPYAGKMNIVAGPFNNDIQATYEKSRRGLRPLVSKPPVPQYEAPTPRAKGYTPTTPPSPPIAPRYFEPDPQHAKYQRGKR